MPGIKLLWDSQTIRKRNTEEEQEAAADWKPKPLLTRLSGRCGSRSLTARRAARSSLCFLDFRLSSARVLLNTATNRKPRADHANQIWLDGLNANNKTCESFTEWLHSSYDVNTLRQTTSHLNQIHSLRWTSYSHSAKSHQQTGWRGSHDQFRRKWSIIIGQRSRQNIKTNKPNSDKISRQHLIRPTDHNGTLPKCDKISLLFCEKM